MNKRFVIFFIFLLALSVRLAFIFDNPRDLESDEIEYNRLAMNLVEARGYINSADGAPTSMRPPFYPVFLAGIYKLFGYSYFIAKIIQGFVGSLCVVFLYLLTERVFNRWVAILTGIFSSFYMSFVYCVNLLYTETLFSFLLIFLIYLVYTAKTIDMTRFFNLGLLCGFLALTRAEGILLPFIVIIFILAEKESARLSFILKRGIFSAFIFLLGFIIVITPWTIRNTRVHNRFVLISTNAGLNMYQAIRPVKGKILGLGPRDDVARIASTIKNEAERNDFYVKSALDAYREDWLRAFRMFVLRFLFFWSVIDWEIMGGNIVNYHFVFIFPFFIFGILTSAKNWKKIALPLAIIIYFVSTTLLFQGAPRYRMPTDGLILMFGCYGIYKFIRNRFRIFCLSIYFLFCYFLYRYSIHTKYILKEIMEKLGLW